MTTATVIADAIHELEAYDDAEHRAALEIVREIIAELDLPGTQAD